MPSRCVRWVAAARLNQLWARIIYSRMVSHRARCGKRFGRNVAGTYPRFVVESVPLTGLGWWYYKAIMHVEIIGRRAAEKRRPASLRLLPMVLAVMVLLLLLPAGVDARPGYSRGASTAGTARQTYRNPVFARDFPDPFVLKVGRAYYAYGTTTAWQPLNHLFPILRSTDLVHWRYVADAFTSAPDWSTTDWWAPDVLVRKGIYYLYYVGHSIMTGQHCIGVATAKRPTGPFTDHGSIACADHTGQGYIDPDPFIDGNGKAYLYLSVDNPYHSISVLPLAADLLHAAGTRKQLFTLSQPWEHGLYFSTVEAPFMVKHGPTYYLFYSGNDWQHDYAMGYATASSPLGPFAKYRGNPILHGTKAVTGPGGGSLFMGLGGWWLAYHAWTGGPGYDSGGVRNLRIDRVTWRKGVVVVRGPTTTPHPMP